MKRYCKSLGVTLLEILLVLAIAAMIIVMSVRYYQSATASQQSNALMSQIQSITAAADNLAQGGSYVDATQTAIAGLLPQNGLTAPWGGAITVTGQSATSYLVTVKETPTAVCTLIVNRLKTDNHYTTVTCTPTGDLTYTYKANP